VQPRLRVSPTFLASIRSIHFWRTTRRTTEQIKLDVRLGEFCTFAAEVAWAPAVECSERSCDVTMSKLAYFPDPPFATGSQSDRADQQSSCSHRKAPQHKNESSPSAPWPPRSSKKLFKPSQTGSLIRPQTGSPAFCPDTERFSPTAEVQERMRRAERHQQHEARICRVSLETSIKLPWPKQHSVFRALPTALMIRQSQRLTGGTVHVSLQIMISKKRQGRAQQEQQDSRREEKARQKAEQHRQYKAGEAAARAAVTKLKSSFDIISLADK